MTIDITATRDSLDTPSTSGVVTAIENEFGFQFWQQTKTLIAVSGGPDSVALLRGMLSIAERNGNPLPGNLIVAHVDHGLRGCESDGDAMFVKALAAKLGLEFVMANSISLAPSKSCDDQESATTGASHSEESLRNFRYENLLATAMRLGARYIVTGHNLNDQIETILFRIFRGTGIAGLSGIPQIRLGNESVSIVRPLLSTGRAEIEAYLKEIKQDFRVDSSNQSSRYQRNYLRNELIPLIESRFGSGFEQSLLRLGGQAEQANEFIVSQSKPLRRAIVSSSPTSIELDHAELRHEPPILVRQFLVDIWDEQNWPRQAMGFEWWETICAAIRTDQSEHQVLNLPGEIRFTRTDNRTTFSKE